MQLEGNAQTEQPQYEHKPDANLKGLKLVPYPPELEIWRQRLFDIDDMIVVSEDEYDAQALFGCQSLNAYPASRSISHTSITYIRTALPKNTRRNHLYHTTGTADSKVDQQGQPNPTTQTRKNGNA